MRNLLYTGLADAVVRNELSHLDLGDVDELSAVETTQCLLPVPRQVMNSFVVEGVATHPLTFRTNNGRRG
jgi:hypothetical protein